MEITDTFTFHLRAITIFFLVQQSLGELGLGGSPRLGHASRLTGCLQRYLQITHQQGSHIDSGI